MNPTDLRDLAAYWGAPVLYRHKPPANAKRVGIYQKGILGAFVMQRLETGSLHSPLLLLRPLSAVTGEELAHCLALAEACLEDPAAFDRDREDIYWKDGRETRFEFGGNLVTSILGVHRHSCEPVKVAAYLQRQGLFVPGTIDPKYVQLTA